MLWGKRKDGQSYPKSGKGHGITSDFGNKEFDGHSEIIDNVTHTFVHVPDIRDKEFELEVESPDTVTVKEFMEADGSQRAELIKHGLAPFSVIIADNVDSGVKLAKHYGRVVFVATDGSMINPDIEIRT